MTKSKWMPQLAMLLLALGVMLSGCDAIFPKKVAAEDCKKWVDHGFEVIKDQMDGAMKKCPAEMKKAMKKEMDKGTAKDDAVDDCKEAVGQKYEGKDADCWMKASTFKDLKACKFKVLEKMGKKKSKKAKKGDDDDDDKKAKKSDDDDDDKDPVEELKKMCDKMGGGGDDDGDSKKKKSDDDDDKPKKKKKSSDD
jgi:hypothetical protein